MLTLTATFRARQRRFEMVSAPSRAGPNLHLPMPTRHLRAVAGLTLLAALLRLPTLGTQSFWLDESVTVRLVRRSFVGMLSALPGSESTPPLYYVLAWPWTRVFGSGEVGLRLLSALFGILTVPVVYAAAVRLVSRRAGVVAGALAATSPLLIWFSQEARAYALLTLLSAVLLLLFARVLERPTPRRYALWALTAALALATHYFAVFVIAPQLAWLLMRRRGPGLAAATLGLAAVAVLLLPLAVMQASGDRAAFIAHSALAPRVLQVPKQDLLGYGFPHQAPVVVLALALAAVGLTLALARTEGRERRGAVAALGIGALAVGVPLVLAAFGLDYLITRNLLESWPALAVGLAAGLATRRAGRAGIAAAAALCALGIAVYVLVETHPAYQRDDWRGLARALGRPAVPRALVIEPLNGYTALALYRPRLERLPSPPTTVEEVDLVAVARGRTRAPAPAPPGFVLVERRITATYALLRLRSPVPELVTAAELAPLRLGSDIADYGFESPVR